MQKGGNSSEGSTEGVGEVPDQPSTDGQGYELSERILGEDGVLDRSECLEGVARDTGGLVVETVSFNSQPAAFRAIHVEEGEQRRRPRPPEAGNETHAPVTAKRGAQTSAGPSPLVY